MCTARGTMFAQERCAQALGGLSWLLPYSYLLPTVAIKGLSLRFLRLVSTVAVWAREQPRGLE